MKAPTKSMSREFSDGFLYKARFREFNSVAGKRVVETLRAIRPRPDWPDNQEVVGQISNSVLRVCIQEALPSKEDLEAVQDGYTILSEQQVRVTGQFAGTRNFDFMARDPSGRIVGFEVKTTLSDVVKLDRSQVLKDVSIMTFGGLSSFGPVDGVAYRAACANCGEAIGAKSQNLKSLLEEADIPFHTIRNR